MGMITVMNAPESCRGRIKLGRVRGSEKKDGERGCGGQIVEGWHQQRRSSAGAEGSRRAGQPPANGAICPSQHKNFSASVCFVRVRFYLFPKCGKSTRYRWVKGRRVSRDTSWLAITCRVILTTELADILGHTDAESIISVYLYNLYHLCDIIPLACQWILFLVLDVFILNANLDCPSKH